MVQSQVYTLAVSGQTCTFTPKTGMESHPLHLGASTIVLTTVAGAAPAEFFRPTSTTGDEFVIEIRHQTKS